MIARKLKLPKLENVELPEEGRLVRIRLLKVEGNAKKEVFEGTVIHRYPNFILLQQPAGAKLKNSYQINEFMMKHIIYEYID